MATTRLFLGVVLVSLAAHAFLPPVDTVGTVTARIEGFPEHHPLGEALPFVVVVEKTDAGELTGKLRVWLNDDWDVRGADSADVRLDGKSSVRFEFTATPKARALAAHYPVHAQISLAGGADATVLHPIAIFQTVAGKAQETAAEQRAQVEQYVCVRSVQTVSVDGKLDEWNHAAALPLGASARSTGEITTDSFDAVFAAMHDDRFVYVSVRAGDNDVSCTDTRTEDFMNSDYVRLYVSNLDPRQRHDTQLGESDVVVAASVSGPNGHPLLKFPTYGLPVSRALAADACRVAMVKTGTGYGLELAVPKAALGTNVADGTVLGFNFMIGDADAGRRRGEVTLGHRIESYWTSPRAYVPLMLSPGTAASEASESLPPPAVQLGAGAWDLARVRSSRWSFDGHDGVVSMPLGWQGGDNQTGAHSDVRTIRRGDESLTSISIHPPWRGAKGGVWGDYHVTLPDVRPISFQVKTAIRDHREEEGASDGVEFKVLASVGGGPYTELFSRFSAAKAWEPARADLSSYAGRTVRLRLWAGPGPAGNTSCDNGFWGAPTVVVGEQAKPVSESTWKEREAQATALAKSAVAGTPGNGAFPLLGRGARFGVGVVPGERGLTDGVIAFSDGMRHVTFRGFTMEVDGNDVGVGEGGMVVKSATSLTTVAGVPIMRISHALSGTGVPLVAEFATNDGGLTLRFSMPGVERDQRGGPRYTRLRLGPCSEAARRVYMGFGNVVEEPEAFDLAYRGFNLSTRQVGADYANGLSLVQATDLVPNKLVCRPADRVFSLEAAHDVTFTFVASTRGAFAALRHYRDLSGFKPAPGVANLLGRMCIDQWGGDYGEAAEGLERAARYGLTHSIFVKHSWQRWGYDYRLPEIYPPRGGLEAFKAMPDVCRKYGILFAPHDNYIDFYPDAEGYSYDHIIFNRDGTPQRAWFNKGREAQSYRWLPHAYMPWLEENMRLMRDGYAPTGLFIDVFSAITPMDYYDRSGRFHSRERTTAEWKRAFDRSREILGPGAPMLSEAGHDALVGSLDGVQSDHYHASRWGIRGKAMCRTPWEDMATHGRFVLLAGGLGHRYGDKDPAHTYGTDDYLSNTVMGGRNPMCDGPFSRRTVMTYWLLHDVCDVLARAEFETHEFGDDSVYRQHTAFSDGSRVWANRGEGKWQVDGRTLPEYGFSVRTPQTTAAACLIDGQRVGVATSPGVFFADARPPFLTSSTRPLSTRVLEGKYVDDGAFELKVEWDVAEPLEAGLRPFVHIGHPKEGDQGEKIAHHGHMNLPEDALMTVGKHICAIMVSIPPDSFGGEYTLRYGMYNPGKGGYRIKPSADLEGDRVRGGKLIVDIADGEITGGRYALEEPLDHLSDLNRERRVIDFGRVTTNGAFRLLYPTDGRWRLVPLPASMPFEVVLKLEQLGTPGRAIAGVQAIDMDGSALGAVPATVRDNELRLELDAKAFAYEIRWK